MLIRCQRCQAVYSLQDGVAAQGSNFRVECGRCQLVFDAQAAHPTPLQTPRMPTPPPAAPAAVERSLPPEQLAQALKPRRPAGDDEDGFARHLRLAKQRRRRMLVGGAAVGLVAL